MQQSFQSQLTDSVFVHYPLKADETKTVETRALKKKVLSAAPLWNGDSLTPWSFEGDGSVTLSPDKSLLLTTESVSDHWPESEVRAVDAQAGDYATFGSYVAKLNVTGIDSKESNRLMFQIKPTCEGLHSPIVRVGFVNSGAVKIPDAYSREGFNAINLKNFEWNTCVWEIGSIAHDCLTEVSFTVHRYGKEVSGGDDLHFELRGIELQKVEEPDVVLGWQCQKGSVSFSTTGYWADGKKTAVANTAEKEFEILNAQTKDVAFKGEIRKVENQKGSFSLIDFSALTIPGCYQIRFGGTLSESFEISSNIADNAVWKIINFLYCERCGYPVPGKHGTCHGDVFAEHNGVTLAYQGGWHDAADVSQQTVQSAEILHAILETANHVKDKNKPLYLRLLEEAQWGIDFILRTRFGDGYRITGAGIRRWTDGKIGNMDDCPARVHNHSFENFLISGVEAYAATVLADIDAQLAWKCADAAKEDFQFAVERFEQIGMDEPDLREHACSASLSQYYAAASWAASQIYRVTDCEKYAGYAAKYADSLLDCQENGELGLPISGFFFRDESKKQIVHFSHQSREQIFMQALEAVCATQLDNSRRGNWENGMKRYGAYLKGLMEYTAPYGMIPAGVFALKEADDEKTFNVIHPRVDYDREKENYKRQVEGGILIANGYYVKCFPVWFSYRGNSAIHLAMGKAASIIGTYFKDKELIEIAREQIYWTLGKNPFGQSLMYGEGSNYGQQYTALLGETVGEMPVGTQTQGNGDAPYWPPANIATYREVWTTPPGRWLWIAADLV